MDQPATDTYKRQISQESIHDGIASLKQSTTHKALVLDDTNSRILNRQLKHVMPQMCCLICSASLTATGQQVQTENAKAGFQSPRFSNFFFFCIGCSIHNVTITDHHSQSHST